MDEYDRERARHQAKEGAQNMYNNYYVNVQCANQYNPNQYGPPQPLQFQQQGGY